MILNDFTVPKTKFSNEQLDAVLAELCGIVIEGQQDNPDFNGMVAAAVIDPQGRLVTGLNYLYGARRVHAERAAIDKYEAEYGDLPRGSIVVTTLSPCSCEFNDNREGPSCSDLLNSKGVKLAYCGYKDPTQENTQDKFVSIFTENSKLKLLCKKLADTFLRKGITEYKERPKSQRAHRDGIDLELVAGNNEYQINATSHGRELGHVLFDLMPYVSDEERKPMLYPQDLEVEPEYRGQGIAAIMYDWAKELGFVVMRSGEQTADGDRFWEKNRPGKKVWENFADGKGPGRPGDSQRHGIRKGATMAELEKASHAKGRKGQLARWQLNMRRGKKK